MGTADFRILHMISGRTIQETADLLGKARRNVDIWLKGAVARDPEIMDQMREADQADEAWVRSTVQAGMEYADQMKNIDGASSRISLSVFPDEKTYMGSEDGYGALHISYTSYMSRLVRVYAVLSYLGYEVEFSYL